MAEKKAEKKPVRKSEKKTEKSGVKSAAKSSVKRAVNLASKKPVFGLDIGTRSIVGTVGYREGDVFTVLAQEVKEHETRAMLDGQIHDIAAVGNTISQVKQALEKKLDLKLKEVCIAAAGRVLETVEVHVDWEPDQEKEIDAQDVAALTSMGIEKAYSCFAEKNSSDLHFYCVGYSVIRFYLNGYQIGNLENHKARSAGVDMIATFLPDEVVDGLYKAVEIAGLRVVNMTLEPIAAITVAIPGTYRMLNIGLVDVGAGTSDICITRDGCIVSYGMIPRAGDCLTEAIARECLVDFNTAELIKRGIENSDVVEYNDIMGLPQKIEKSRVLEILEPQLEEMTAQVAEKFKELNGGKPVSAVFVVGGGGRIEGYTRKLSEHLGILSERVAVRGEEVMGKVRFTDVDMKKDSLMVTPIGICLNYYEQSSNFIHVSFNGEYIKIYDSGNLAVVDAAMHADFPNEGLFPRRGKEINYTVNGKKAFKRGSLGEAAQISVNGEPADMHTPIHAGDTINVTPSTTGEAAKLKLSEVPEFRSMIAVRANDSRILLPRVAEVNGEIKTEFYEIKDGDDVVIRDYVTVREVRDFMDVLLDEDTEILVNNEVADDNTKVYDNFSIKWGLKAEEAKKEISFRSTKKKDRTETEVPENIEDFGFFDEEPAEEKKESVSGGLAASFDELPEDDGTYVPSESRAEEAEDGDKEDDGREDNAPVRSILIYVNGNELRLEGKSEYVFVDVFDHIDFDLQNVKGRRLITTRNGHKAEYMETLDSGDVISIRWED
ncbi:MAG: rod shape-determining protein [Lachnospiraceae bacterium]|nr:rod shape-determining protein [Lachnospiraceae bacterium]